MRRALLIAALLAVTTLSASNAALAEKHPQWLEPLDYCPDTFAACVAAETSDTNAEPGESKDIIGQVPARENHSEGGLVIRIEGRLNGGPKTTYGLIIWKSGMECGLIGPAAYLGRSERNNPIILTTKGTLEIFGNTVGVGSPVEAIVLDERTGAKAELIGDWLGSNQFIFDGHGGAFIVIQQEARDGLSRIEQCIEAPRARPGRLRLAPGHCDGPDGLEPQARASLHPNARVAKILDDMDTAYEHDLFVPWNRMWRVTGTHTLVIKPNYPCT